MPDAVTYLQLEPGALPPPLKSEPFRVIVVARLAVSPEWQALVSDWLVQAGCLYMMAWGVECSSWDDSVDLANLDRYDFADIPDMSSVVTTWHDGEPLEEVFWFAKHSAQHPKPGISRTVILDISAENRNHQLLESYAVA